MRQHPKRRREAISTSLSEDDYQRMQDCMAKKADHTILVTEEITEVKVPTDMPGRTTTAHFAKYHAECVSAPGFLELWRKELSMEDNN